MEIPSLTERQIGLIIMRTVEQENRDDRLEAFQDKACDAVPYIWVAYLLIAGLLSQDLMLTVFVGMFYAVLSVIVIYFGLRHFMVQPLKLMIVYGNVIVGMLFLFSQFNKPDYDHVHKDGYDAPYSINGATYHQNQQPKQPWEN